MLEIEIEEFESIHPVEYDDSGRMKYNPGIHFTQYKPWTNDDLEYLINWYSKTGLEEMSLALGKTEPKISRMLIKLRKQGLIKEDKKHRITRVLSPKNTKERKKKLSKLNVPSKELIKLLETMSYQQIADMYKVSKRLIQKRIYEYKKATKNPDQSVQSSITKNSRLLYHKSEVMQIG